MPNTFTDWKRRLIAQKPVLGADDVKLEFTPPALFRLLEQAYNAGTRDTAMVAKELNGTGRRRNPVGDLLSRLGL